MITHVVLFKLKDRSSQSVKITRDVLANMEGQIPYLKSLEVGMDVLHQERSYDLVLITKFDSMQDLESYQVHPVHLEVGKHIASVKESAVAVDFES